MGDWLSPCPGCSTPGRDTQYPLYRGLYGPQDRSGHVCVHARVHARHYNKHTGGGDLGVLTGTNTQGKSKPHSFASQTVALFKRFHIPTQTAQIDLLTERLNHALHVKISKDFYSFMYLYPWSPKEIVVPDLSTKKKTKASIKII
jgi:hypothetical protein